MRHFSWTLIPLAFLFFACADEDTNPYDEGPDASEYEISIDPNQPNNPNPNPGGGTDTSTPPKDPNPPEEGADCTPEEAGATDFGGSCSRDCECRTSDQGFCYSGPYLEGFSFCTRAGGGPAFNSDVYPTVQFHPDCWDFPRAEWIFPMTQSCSTVDDCKALSSAYTHCGTGHYPWSRDQHYTECLGLNGSVSIMQGKKLCIIDSAPPFNR